MLSQSPFAGPALDDCIACCANGDAILLLRDGCYAASANSVHSDKLQQLIAAKPDISLYLLQQDWDARGLPQQQLLPAVSLIDMARWVSLSESHDKLLSWY